MLRTIYTVLPQQLLNNALNPSIMSTLLIRIRRLRELVGYSQDEVADKLGITQGAYCRLEKGHTRLDFERLEKIAAVYGFTQNDLTSKHSAELVKLLIENPRFKDLLEGGGGKYLIANTLTGPSRSRDGRGLACF